MARLTRERAVVDTLSLCFQETLPRARARLMPHVAFYKKLLELARPLTQQKKSVTGVPVSGMRAAAVAARVRR